MCYRKLSELIILEIKCREEYCDVIIMHRELFDFWQNRMEEMVNLWLWRMVHCIIKGAAVICRKQLKKDRFMGMMRDHQGGQNMIEPRGDWLKGTVHVTDRS